jgi:hypothetical protein
MVLVVIDILSMTVFRFLDITPGMEGTTTCHFHRYKVAREK